MKYNDFELVYMVKENEEALNIMIKKYEPLFKKIAFYYVNGIKGTGLDIEDLVQQCRITVCHVLERYNEKNDVLFYSYLLVCLRRSLNNFVRSNRIKEEVVYYMEYDNIDHLSEFSISDNCEDSFFDRELRLKLIDFKHTLPFNDSIIFELRCNGFSYKEIASLLDIKYKRVDNSLLLSRKKLEKYLLF